MEEEKKKRLMEKIKIPKEINVTIDDGLISVKGKVEAKRMLFDKRINIETRDDQIIIASKNEKFSKNEKKIIGTFKAHIKNLISGANEPHKYVLKICSGHFPMNVSVDKNEFVVKNFLGEKVPRVMKIKDGVDVKVEGDKVAVESPDKEKAGQCAASIEQLTKRTGYDNRVFQDGIWIVSKSKRELK